MLKRMMILINPVSGRGGYKSSIADIMDIFCSAGYIPSVFFTRHAGHATELILQNAPDFDIVVCLGGDGTLSDAAAGMMRLNKTVPIGYIPLGTANDVARTLSLSSKPAQAAAQIANGSPRALDIGLFGPETYFTYIVAFGAFTEVSYGTNSDIKHALGQFAYMLEGMRSLTKIVSYKTIVEYDNGVLCDDFIFGAVVNSTSIAGLVQISNGQVDLSDGLFEVVLVRQPTDLFDLNDIITGVLSGKPSGDNILFIKSKEVRFTFKEPVKFTRDGEDGGAHSDICISCCHPGIDIVM